MFSLKTWVLQAQAVALTVAQAFTVAFELWQVAKEGRHHFVLPQSLRNDTFTCSHRLVVQKYETAFFMY